MTYPLGITRALIAFLILLFFQAGLAQEIPPIPDPPRLVNDLYGLLHKSEVDELEHKLRNYNDSTSTELVIVIENSSHGRETMEYATDLFSNWKIGKAGKDNGILIYIAFHDRRMAIVTGYGMEGAVPDASTYTIREKILKPHFKEGEFYKGLDEASTAIFLLAAGEYSAEELDNAFKDQTRALKLGLTLLFVLILFITISIQFRNKGPKAIGRPLSPWEVLILGSGMGRSSSGWTDFSSGSGGFGAGGGFGGFGGGMTGGGGSAGSW